MGRSIRACRNAGLEPSLSLLSGEFRAQPWRKAEHTPALHRLKDLLSHSTTAAPMGRDFVMQIQGSYHMHVSADGHPWSAKSAHCHFIPAEQGIEMSDSGAEEQGSVVLQSRRPPSIASDSQPIAQCTRKFVLGAGGGDFNTFDRSRLRWAQRWRRHRHPRSYE